MIIQDKRVNCYIWGGGTQFLRVIMPVRLEGPEMSQDDHFLIISSLSLAAMGEREDSVVQKITIYWQYELIYSHVKQIGNNVFKGDSHERSRLTVSLSKCHGNHFFCQAYLPPDH